ncbi:TPA: hypothetical protein MX298_003826 [Escherichia coli]|uniref:hypothetical protein n=1 Tax=Escherichia coli TaxID=562 RepID=UPI000DD715BA|nr:hypothetical protein [Escherichia coli]EGF7435709.1 hypothetical protein [Escherichia coli]EIZ2886525.1 hypothetical protein [Escherichia coli]EJE2981447.1 hypothetical protein [Escherichia coli]HAX4942335.1 hypothetical protein [Escherichia coli]HBE5163459.1 hypothetical protein [Escherichia coli]
MKLTPEEHTIVSAITHQYRKQHTGAGRREIIETFNRARATVLEMRRNTQDYASELPTFVWKKTPPRR